MSRPALAMTVALEYSPGCSRLSCNTVKGSGHRRKANRPIPLRLLTGMSEQLLICLLRRPFCRDR